jgi:hypothetical protein
MPPQDLSAVPPGLGEPAVISLASFRSEQRLVSYRRRIDSVLDSNRQAVGRLYHTGALFSRQGARAGRDLLLAHQHLLKVVSLLNRLEDKDQVPAPRQPAEIEAIYRELDLLLERTGELTQRTESYIERLRS